MVVLVLKMCDDAGHGGRDPGAIGPTGLKEKDITLPVTKKVAAYLASTGWNIKLTREDDRHLGLTNVSDLAARVKVAEDFKADLFLSIHCNSATNQAARGMEIYTTPGQGKSDPIAESIVRSWQKEFPDMPIRKDLSDGDSDKEEKFYVLRETSSMPAVLIELAFISNPEEEKLLADPVFQDRAAKAIAQGICESFGVEFPGPVKQPIAQAPWVPDKAKIQVGDTVVEGVMIDEKVYAPVRALLEAMERKLTWDDATKTVTII